MKKALVFSILAASLAMVSCKNREFNEVSESAGVGVGTTRTIYNVHFDVVRYNNKVTASCFYRLDGMTKDQIAQVSAAKTEEDYYKLFPILAKGNNVNDKAILQTVLTNNAEQLKGHEFSNIVQGTALVGIPSCFLALVSSGSYIPADAVCLGTLATSAAATKATIDSNKGYDRGVATATHDFFVVSKLSDKDQDKLIELINGTDPTPTTCPLASDLFNKEKTVIKSGKSTSK